MSFDKVVHQHAPTLWRVASKRGIRALTIADAHGIELEELPPSASEAARDDGARVFHFGGSAPSVVELEVVVRTAGWSRRRLQLADDAPLAVSGHRTLADISPFDLEAMRRERIDEGDILAAARLSRGLERMDQIRYAVLESTGGISIVPEETKPTARRPPSEGSSPA